GKNRKRDTRLRQGGDPDGAAAIGSAGEAADMLDASPDHLAATDWTALGTSAHADMLVRLSRAQTKLTAVNTAVLAAFTAGNGYEPEGHRSAKQWLIGKTGISEGAARGAVSWQRRPVRHPVIAEAMTVGHVSESWARQIAEWTDPLPEDKRAEA